MSDSQNALRVWDILVAATPTSPYTAYMGGVHGPRMKQRGRGGGPALGREGESVDEFHVLSQSTDCLVALKVGANSKFQYHIPLVCLCCLESTPIPPLYCTCTRLSFPPLASLLFATDHSAETIPDLRSDLEYG